MISPQELRIGNWFSHTNENGTFNLQVEEIRSTGVITPWNGGSWFVSFDKLDPIHLTEEIILKCGFEKREMTEDGIIYGLLNTTIIYGKTTDGDYAFFLNKYCNDVHLKHLHQLQNLYFALVGKELEVKL